MNRTLCSFALLVVVAAALAASASASNVPYTLTPKLSFGGGDGWLSPDEEDDLTTDNTQRGLTYNPATGNVLVVDRNGGTTVKIFDGTTGADLGDLDTTGLSGGVFLLNMIDVADDGAIYAANLRTNTDAASFKIYRWADEASAPTVAFDGVPTNGAGIRLGDTLAAIGSGTETLLLAGANDGDGDAGGDPGDTSFAVFSTADGANFSGAVQDFGGTQTNVGAFRLGIDFIDPNTIIGREAGAPADAPVADFAGGSATQIATAELLSAGEAPLAVSRMNNLLATVDINSNDVRLYDINDPDNPLFLGIFNNTTSHVSNGNGVGDLKFGDGMLYVLNTNNGIQAFNLAIIPEPATLALLGVGVVGLGLGRRRR